ncbi:VanZ family protein [uncultured Anaerofustis sp.]|uniref:VanZ family protein n=1 Tax=uncultured Anaerofustis sp. TaxID=904996 RepID=UPI0025CECB35|nr:VanZ family protein [uncultured Anaerofustis sp.]
MQIQLSLFEAIMDTLYLKPLFFIGLLPICIFLYIAFKNNTELPKAKTIICTVLMYYYICLLFNNVVGIPTLKEFFRLSRLGEPFFNPNINLIPLDNGIGAEFILNILCFVPLGFLLPMLSYYYENPRKVISFAFGLSLMIEISQLFTLYRATDINDLVTNIFGAVSGYILYKFIIKIKSPQKADVLQSDLTKILPTLIIMICLIFTFIS